MDDIPEPRPEDQHHFEIEGHDDVVMGDNLDQDVAMGDREQEPAPTPAEPDRRTDFQDATIAGFVPSAETFNLDWEHEPDPNMSEVERRCLTHIEYRKQAYVMRNYCTNKQAREEWLKWKAAKEEEEELNPPKVPEPVEWVADDLYGSVVGRRGPTGPNPVEVFDPSVPQSDYPLFYFWQHFVNLEKTEQPEPEYIIPKEEEQYYIGPLEPRSPPPDPLPTPPSLDPFQPSTSATPGHSQRRRSSLQNLSENDRVLHKDSSMAQMSLNDAPPPPSLLSTPDTLPDASPDLTMKTEEENPYQRSGAEDPALMYFYDEDFCLIPGDVIIFSRPRVKERPQGGYDVMNSVYIYEDVHFFRDHGTYRANFLDGYPLEAGDMVVRFGNFNRQWMWNRHPTINFYMYWPGLIPPSSSGKKQLHPWYWIDSGLLQYGGNHPKARTLPIPDYIVQAHTPVLERSKNFQMLDGDVLIHHVMKPTKVPPFDHKLVTCVWNPILAGVGIDKFVTENDRVLRHGMNFQVYHHGPRLYSYSAVAHVELYFIDDQKCWRYLGRWTSIFDDHLRHPNRVRWLSDVPLVGDVVFDRNLQGRVTKPWDPELNIGGLVCFHENELQKDFGRDYRRFVWYKDTGLYGLGNVTMVLRYGRFNEDNTDDWVWNKSRKLELFILNTRGSSWRRCACEKWPRSMARPKPNYNWKPYNPNDVCEVDPNFKPQSGDVILHLHTALGKERNENPVYTGISYNPHYDTKIEMSLWYPSFAVKLKDYIIRAGYETNSVNPKWINATVEAYCFENIDGKPQWRFKGRDMYIYGTNYLHDGLKDVQKSGVGDLRVDDIRLINDSKTRQAFGRYR